jgi:hypothetical protein
MNIDLIFINILMNYPQSPIHMFEINLNFLKLFKKFSMFFYLSLNKIKKQEIYLFL